MTFKDVVIKNLKHNFKTYGSFYLCSTFTVTLFFIFTTLFYNKAISSFIKDVGINVVMNMIMGFISVFAVMFISYVHTSMKKRRSKEFGLLMTFGMTAKDIGRIIFIEDSLLSGTTILSGVLAGTLFSRLVHMFVNRLMELDVPYSLSYKCFIATIVTFIIIFTAVILWGWLGTRRLEILKLLREERKTEYTGDGSIPTLILGVVMVSVLVAVSVISENHSDVAQNSKIAFASMLLGLTGAYLMIANIFPILLKLIKTRRKFYNRNMLMLAEAKYSIVRNKKLIFLSTILCTVIITSFSSSLAIRMNMVNIVNSYNLPDIEYIQAANVNNFSDADIRKLISEENLTLKSEVKFECIFVDAGELSEGYNLPVTAISTNTFNSISPNKTSVEKGTAKLSGASIVLPNIRDNCITVSAGSSTLVLPLTKPENISVINMGMYKIHNYSVILNDEDYNTLKNALPPGMKGIVHRYRIDDWLRSKGLIEKLAELSDKTRKGTETADALLSLGTAGNYDGYLSFKKMNSIILFTFMFLCLLFYFASILMLVLRQFETLERTRRKYNQLRKIGITKKEFGKTLSGEIRIIFMTPVVFGVILSYALIMLILAMFGMPGVQDIMEKAVLFTGVYVVLQFISCQLAGVFFLKRVTE